MEKLHIKRDDTVVVISGDSKGTRGKVIATSPEEGKVIVAGAISAPIKGYFTMQRNANMLKFLK